MTINKVLIIGNGAMAQHIGLQCAIFGNEVVIYIRTPKKNDIVKASLMKVADSLIADNLVTEDRIMQSLSRISYSNSVAESCKDVDLVSESVAENLEVKIDVWKKFAPFLPAHAILTTNTSSMIPSMFAEASGAPERFLAWHFHLTVFRQNLADIMPHSGTDPKYVDVMKDFTTSIQQNYCMMKKESPGYLANSMLFVVLDKALDLYLSGAADFIEIDKAWMAVRLENSGPFGIMDKIGLDVMQELLPDSNNKSEKLKLLDSMVQNGKSGFKTSCGFYNYPAPTYSKSDFVIRPKSIK